jgi:hypothetical protein
MSGVGGCGEQESLALRWQPRKGVDQEMGDRSERAQASEPQRRLSGPLREANGEASSKTGGKP